MFVSVLEAGKGAKWRRVALSGGLIGAMLALAEAGAITAVSATTGAIWHLLAYGTTGEVQSFIDVGILTGLLYTLPFLFGADYRVDHFLAGRRTITRIINVWTYAFFALAVLAFLTKTTGDASRVGLGLFFFLGSATVLGTDALLRQILKGLVAHGIVAPRRLLIIGPEVSLTQFIGEHATRDTGFEITVTVILPEAEDADDNGPPAISRINWAIDKARAIGINDVLILTGDSNKADLATRIADRFLDLPVAVHLGHLPLATRFPRLQVARIGNARTLALRSAPLNPYQRALKRVMDVAGALLGLILLSPLFAVVALLIKLDSDGPVFFRQRRRGFNQRQFAIWKFRTMTTMEDGAHIKQAVANDPRVTRVGRVLRRFNIDELPQLVNVLMGDMSLVGPRPHAVAHDEHYERVIRRYVRRLNVKPGITGWAQVNGFRGLTETEHAMRSRITHDLYYIDNWSIALDLYIIALTVLSPKAFRNAH